MRDGAENLEKNHGIFECCVDVLDHNHVLGIMPEGNQGPYRRLRPLVKGIFRIAFTAQQKYGTLPGVKIVPIGIDMGDFEKYGEHIIINVGKPIEVSDFMAEYTENPVNATNLIRDRLHDDLSKLTFDLASEKYYESFETATEVANTTADIRQNKQNKFYTRFIARQETAKRLITLENEEPEKAEKLEALCREYKENLNILNLESKAFGEKPFNMVAMALYYPGIYGRCPIQFSPVLFTRCHTESIENRISGRYWLFTIRHWPDYLPFFLPLTRNSDMS